MPEETPVDLAAACFSLGTEAFAVLAAGIIQLAVHVVVVRLQLGNAQDLMLTTLVQVLDVI